MFDVIIQSMPNGGKQTDSNKKKWQLDEGRCLPITRSTCATGCRCETVAAGAHFDVYSHAESQTVVKVIFMQAAALNQ